MLRLRLLGSPQIYLHGEPIGGLSALKGQALLYYLAMQGRPQLRLALAGMFWGAKNDTQALVNLRQALRQLRLALPGCIIATRTSVAIDPGMPVAVDALRFAQLAGAGLAGDMAALRAAGEAYEGELLAGLYLDDALGFEEWLLQEREWLRGLAFRCLRALLDGAVSQRAVGPGIRYARRLLALEPWLEEAHRQLMQLLAWDGQVGAALAQYERCRLLLLDELGVPPSAETQALYRQIRAGAMADAPAPPAGAPAARPHSLPALPTSFVGRERELADLARLLRAGAGAAPRLLTIIGAGGVGKTRLAIELAAALRDDFAGGVYLVELAALADPARAPAAVAEALGLAERAGAAIIELIGARLRGRRALLLLDNCEHLLAACAGLADALLHACPDLHIVATSREALRVGGEARFPLLPLATPDRALPLGRLAENPAIRLFLERAGALQPDLRLSAETAPAIAQICRELDGLPLAIELAAARAADISVAQIAAGLSDRFQLVAGARGPAHARHQTLRAMIDWSVDLLAPAERELLARLAVFAGGWTLEACEAVCADADAPGGALAPAEILALLIGLVDTSLAVLSDSDARYHLLETIRQYAGERLRAGRGEAALRARHLGYYCALAERAAAQLSGPGQAEWLGRLAAEHDNLRAALAYALEAAPAAALRLAGALGQFWHARGFFSEAREMLERALRRAPADPTRWRARALRWSGRLAYRHAENDLARARLTESIAICRSIDDAAGAAEGLNRLAVLLEGEGAYDEALDMFAESLAIYRRLGDSWGSAAVLFNLAQNGRLRSDYAAARRCAEESLAIQRTIGDRHGAALSLDALGEIATAQGDYAAARAYLADALAIQQAIGDRQGVAFSLTDQGKLALAAGDLDLAQARTAQALALWRELGSPSGIAEALTDQGWLALARGDVGEAGRLLDEALEIQGAVGIRADSAYTLCYRGWAARAAGDPELARSRLAQSLAIQRTLRDRLCVALCLIGVAQIEVESGSARLAARLAAAAGAIYAGGAVAPGAAARAAREALVEAARARLGPAAFAEAWAAGYGLALEQAIDAALTPPAPIAAEPVAASLPAQLTSFVERPAELAAIRGLLQSHRLLTLTGPGGVGKTRLALRAAELLGPQFAHGACFVDLAPLGDPARLPLALADALGLRPAAGQPPADAIRAHLSGRHMLLVIDNCEHLVAACAELLGPLLDAAPGVRAIATSREALRVRGAARYVVPPLETPGAGLAPEPAALAAYGSIRLFCERAAAARPAFALSAANAPAVAAICRQLDGLPLAIELAAARVSALSAAQIAARLGDRMRLLGGGSSARPRHQSLRAAIDWSYALLADPERALLRQMAVFAGGAADADIAAVAEAPAPAALLDALVDKSLAACRHDESGARYWLLESIRDYARERLAAEGEEPRARLRHLRHFAERAEAIERQSAGGEQAAMVCAIEAEIDNLRAAMAWSQAAPADLAAEARDLGLRLAGAIWPYWALRGGLDEGRDLLDALLRLAPDRPSAARARGLYGLAALVGRQAAVARSPAPLLEESAAICREFGDDRGLARALSFLGATLERHDPQQARARIAAGLAIFRRIGDRAGVGESLHYLGRNAMNRGDLAAARACYEESRTIWRALGNSWGLADSLNALGTIALAGGDVQLALGYYQESLALSTQLGLRLNIATVLCNLGNAELSRGRHVWAAAHAQAGLAAFAELDNRSGIAHCLAILSRLADLAGDGLRAARLDGAARALRAAFEVSFGLAELGPFSPLAPLDPLAVAEGRAMSLEQALAYAAKTPQPAPHAERAAASSRP